MTDGPRTTVTPIALRDAPQLDAVGVHEPHALRAIVGTAADKGISGLGETYAGQGPLRRLARAAGTVIRPGVLALPLGAVRVPRAPDPGTERDRDAVARLRQPYPACGLRNRDGTASMQRLHPDHRFRSPHRQATASS
ncbi:hypothetical protein ABZS81_22145 [Streptomyces sp. NPDC005318]|uniref:hypothetical protein n=1 Tax=Streptomyces sp. NPDC005318 TaxID=3157031 RepID=UPI0033B3E9F4